MHCQSVFERHYWRPRDKLRCDHRGRVLEDCPVFAIADKLLTPVYGPDLQVSRCESSTSLIIRPDPFFGIFRQRAARQSFIFEKQSVGESGLSLVGSIDVRCPSQDERRNFLRSDRWKEALYCAAGYLRPPCYMTSERGYHIPLLDFYSTHNGLLPFLCTPYVSHHGFFGYVCGQAAVYLCLEMMLHFGATPHSPATINHLLSKLPRARYYDPRFLVATCKDHALDQRGTLGRGGPNEPEGFYNRPMYQREFEDLFENGGLGTRGLCIDLSISLEEPSIVTVLHLKAMLNSRIPVVAVVDFNPLARALRSDLKYEAEAGHVVTIVGYAREEGQSEFRVVFHDGHLGPYRELPISRFIETSLSTTSNGKPTGKSLAMYSPLPARVSPQGYRDLLLEVVMAVESGIECNIRLLHVRSLRPCLLAYAPGQSAAIEVEKLEALIAENRDEYIWLVEYRDKSGTYFDLIDTGEATERRLGVLSCGVDTQSDSWVFYPAVGDARRITLNPIRAMSVRKGAKGVRIKVRAA